MIPAIIFVFALLMVVCIATCSRINNLEKDQQ